MAPTERRDDCMKFKSELLLEADRETVWNTFDDVDKLESWVQDLIDYRPVSGKLRQVGAVAELVYRENGRQLSVTETITERRAPDFTAAMHEAPDRKSLIVNTFKAIDAQSTRWSVWGNVRFLGVRKWAGLLLIKEIQRRLENDMQRFKLLVETEQASAIK